MYLGVPLVLINLTLIYNIDILDPRISLGDYKLSFLKMTLFLSYNIQTVKLPLWIFLLPEQTCNKEVCCE